MTNEKKSALEQLKEQDGSYQHPHKPATFRDACLELAERVQASEAKLEALAEKVELIIETQTAAKNNQLTFAQVTEMLEPIVKKLEALELECGQTSKAYLVDVPKTTDVRTIEQVEEAIELLTRIRQKKESK